MSCFFALLWLFFMTVVVFFFLNIVAFLHKNQLTQWWLQFFKDAFTNHFGHCDKEHNRQFVRTDEHTTTIRPVMFNFSTAKRCWNSDCNFQLGHNTTKQVYYREHDGGNSVSNYKKFENAASSSKISFKRRYFLCFHD